MKKTIAIIMILAMSMMTIVWAGNLEGRMKTVPLASEIKANGMKLQDLLDLLTQANGIELIAVPEVADLKVDLVVNAEQTIGGVLAALHEKYGLIGKLNAAKTAVILIKGDYVADRMFGGKAMPSMAIRESAKASPSISPPGAVRPVRPTPLNTEEYKNITDNSFQDARNNPLSTFSIDVDTASYSNVRRFINSGNLPPADAVRTEELLNYFSYDYPQPGGEHPVSLTTEVGVSPWNPARKLVMLGLQAKNVNTENLPASNLVFFD